ncbi:MAG TPA: amidohydrolase family protein [Vicinamibacterales bacterium]|nr:amidohydrolase family protein [Vicinamibacterales bacterium]
MRHHLAAVLAAAALAGAAVAADQQPAAPAPNPYASTYQPLPARTTVIRNATILTAAGPAIERGSILLQNGKVAAVGAAVTAPTDAAVIDAAGKWVTPGVIDTHSHLGVYAAPAIESLADGNEMTSPNTAEVSTEHAIWPQDPQFELALAGGVTTLHILPGSANLFGGRSVTVKNVPARTADQMKFPGAPYGLKMACGENPMRLYGGRNTMPSTRMGNAAGYRKAWQAATEYRERMRAWKAGGADPAKRPDRNLQLETLMGVLDGEIRVQNHCYRADEMATMIDISREFNFKIASFHHAVEAYKVRDLLAANGICGSMWADWWGFKLEAYDGITQNIALVHEAGGCAIVHSDSADGIQRLNQEAAKAIRAGAEAGIAIDRADAVKWLSLNPAKALGIDQVTGSLEPGKNADVVIWSGDPFSVYAHAERVFIDGAQVFDRSQPRTPRSDFELGQVLPAPPARGVRPGSEPGQSGVRVGSERGLTPLGGRPNGAGSAVDVRRAATDAGPTIAITNARIHPVSGPVIQRGTIVMRGGRIAAVGANVTVPAGAQVIDAAGKTVTPGLIDSAVQIGLVEIPLSGQGTADESTTDARVSAAFNVVDSFNGNSAVIPVTRVEGVTRALVTPGGTGNVFAGQAAVIDLSGGQVPASVTRGPAAMIALLGEPGAGVAGGSRSTAVLRIREILQDAQDYALNRLAFNTAQRRDYARSRLDLEALQPVLKGQIPLAVQANRASDLLAALRLAGEFKLRLVLVGASEGWMVADQLAAANVPVVIKPLTNIPSFESLGATLENAARLSGAGVQVAIASFDTQNSRNIRQEAGNAIANGLSRDAALEAVTLAPARLWGVSDRLGSIEPGKDADLVIWSTADPFELTGGAERVFIKGREMPTETRQRALLKRYRTLTR